MRYGFEGIIANEFHTLNGKCATLVPSGPGYENVQLENQVCSTIGSIPGQDRVDGNRFIALAYDYSYSHVWRNFGIIIAFGIAFVSLLMFFSEWNTNMSGAADVMLFKRGSDADVLQEAKEKTTAGDEEKAGSRTPPSRGTATNSPIMSETPAMTDIFTWQKLQYDVPVGGGQMRRLLDDVSGFVAPGKLTALMGESGAGKVSVVCDHD